MIRRLIMIVAGLAAAAVAGAQSSTPGSTQHAAMWISTLANATPIPRDGLVAEYKFAANANDTSGRGNHGTAFNATITNGLISLGGSNGYLSIGSDTSVDDVFLKGGTLSMWVYMRSSGGGGGGRFTEADSVNSGLQSFYPAQFQFIFTSANNAFVAPGVVTGRWYSIIFSSSGVTGNVASIYVDGALLSTNTQAGSGSYVSDAAYSKRFFNNSSGIRGFDGLADNIRMWTNKVLSVGERAAVIREGHD